MSTIAENLTRIQNAKAAIKTSVAAKGVTIPDTATIDSYSTYVDQIEQGGGTDADILTDDYGNPIYIKAKSTTTSVNVAGCKKLEELDLSDADMTTVILCESGNGGNVSINGCTNLAKIKWPTKMTAFVIYTGGLYDIPKLTEIPTVNGGYNGSYNLGIREITLGDPIEGSEISCDLLGYVIKINKAWTIDTKCKINSDSPYLYEFDTDNFYIAQDRSLPNLATFDAVEDMNCSNCFLIKELTVNENTMDCSYMYTLETLYINWAWEDGGNLDTAGRDDNAFYRCLPSLTDLYISHEGNGVPVNNHPNTFLKVENTVPYGLKIHVPESLLEEYKADESWADYKECFVAI